MKSEKGWRALTILLSLLVLMEGVGMAGAFTQMQRVSEQLESVHVVCTEAMQDVSQAASSVELLAEQVSQMINDTSHPITELLDGISFPWSK